MKNPDHDIDSLFMRRVFDLATNGRGKVSPNPLVGCVVVHDGKVIGEGWHRQYGGPHAEVNAINSVEDKSLLSASTVYVNLEPCSHTGKTPPCADLLIKHRVKKVVVANLDTNPLVGGEGARRLRAAGIEVVTGVLDLEGRDLNRRFFTFMEEQRPFIILKWAQTSDGFIARETYESKWISNEYARQLVHQWRAQEDCIMVGTRTAMHDNPRLNVRDWSGRNPVRVVLDRYGRLNKSLALFDQQQPTLCYTLTRHEEHPNLAFVRVDEENFFSNVIHDLYKRRLQSMIVEGGAQTLQWFIDNKMWDEAHVFIGNKSFGKGVAAPAISGTLVQEHLLFNNHYRVYRYTHD